MMIKISITSIARDLCEYVNANIDCLPIRLQQGLDIARGLFESLVVDVNRHGFDRYDAPSTISIVLCEVPAASVYDAANMSHIVLAYLVKLYTSLQTDYIYLRANNGASITLEYDYD